MIGRVVRRIVGPSQAVSERHPLPDPLPWARAHGPTATVDDIFYCFRLLLGRSPNAEEWRGHAARVGADLGQLVAGYLDSLEFKRRGLSEATVPTDIAVAEWDGFRIHAARDDLAVGRHVLAGAYEPEIVALVRRVLKPGMGVIDIGANIGFFAMLAASIVGAEGYVLAIEPNPANARLLEASRRLNGFDQVSVAAVAAADRLGMLALNVSYSNGTTSPPAEDLAGLLAATMVPCVPVDALVRAGRRIDFIKIDVEGAEYTALRGAQAIIARDQPVIVSEFSPNLMPGISGIDGVGYLRWLATQGYLFAAIQSDGAATLASADPAPILDSFAARATDHIDILAAGPAEWPAFTRAHDPREAGR